jgi:predicted patatin/cPLA2 family phospholipase
MEESTIKKEHPKIKHLSISGGATWGFQGLGIIYEAVQQKFIDLKNIESVYGISIGSIIATMILLNIDLDIIINYIIKRPWGNVWKITIDDILQSYQKKGIFDKKIIVEFFSPLLKSVDLSIDITMKQFYEYSGVELHIYTTEVNQFEFIDLSYKTHPDWLLLDAIYASSAIPSIFSPLFLGEQCFIDGGVFLNDPSCKCIEDVVEKGGAIEEIFSIAKKDADSKITTSAELQKANIFEFHRIIIHKLLYTIREKCIKEKEENGPLYEIKTICNTNTVDDVIAIMNSSDIRKSKIDEGIEAAKAYFLHTIHQLG